MANSKICPVCRSEVLASAKVCPECGEEFFEKKPTSTDRVESSGKLKNTKYVREDPGDCPYCGTKKGYVGESSCGKCGLKFDRQRTDGAYKKEDFWEGFDNEFAPKKKKESPKIALTSLSIWLIVYNVALVLVLAMLLRWIGEIWFMLITIGSIVISFFVGMGIGYSASNKYGIGSFSLYWLYCLLVLFATGLVDYYYFTKYLPLYSGSMEWGMGAMAISISCSILSSLIFIKSSLNEYYCPSCCLTNVLRYECVENEKEVYGYKYRTHKAETRTATISTFTGSVNPVRSASTVEYTVPGYQENLGLHKTTTKDTVYICKRCGRKVVRKSSFTEKVDM